MTSLTDLKGIGEKRAGLFKKLGVLSVEGLLALFPRDYRDFSQFCPCVALTPGERCSVVRLSGEPRVAFVKRNLTIVSAKASDETGQVRLVWYNQPYVKRQLTAGEVYLVSGRVGTAKTPCYENPAFEKAPPEGMLSPPGIVPVYPTTKGLSQGVIRDTVRAALAFAPISETLPAAVRLEMGLCQRNYALEQVHFPMDLPSLQRALTRIRTEDALLFLLAVESLKRRRAQKPGFAFKTEGIIAEFSALLPYTPTEAQKRVMEEIARDMNRPAPMNRLVQGDVGAGKTVPAMLAMYIAAKNGRQAMLMAPTEVLARQHYNTATALFGGAELLLGSMTTKEKREAYGRINTGQSRVIIGTQALLQDKLDAPELGLVIADEQHRFGVRQRAVLSRGDPDMLIMSATPIPRTLALMLYGDLDISLLDQLPPGRKKVITATVPPEKRQGMYDYIRKQAQLGKQAYVVCPLVEESELVDALSAEEVYQELTQGLLKDIRVGLLHGRMGADKKQEVLNAFRAGEIDVLVSTTVVEVGVDVPNASTMVIEGADRFGLAQLHQLRGRVGRGSAQSYCFLLTCSQSEQVAARLGVVCGTNDGFEIAREDLRLRGPGQFLGTRQSGGGDFMFGDLLDMDVLKKAQQMAARILAEEEFDKDRALMLELVGQFYGQRMESTAMN